MDSISSKNEFQTSEIKESLQSTSLGNKNQKKITGNQNHKVEMFLIIPNTKGKQPQARENKLQFDFILESMRLHSSRLADTRLGTRNSDRSP